jgi:hypothetical protein
VYPLGATDYDLYDDTSFDDVNPGDVSYIKVSSSGSGHMRRIAERDVWETSGPAYQVMIPLDYPDKDYDYLDNPDDDR